MSTTFQLSNHLAFLAYEGSDAQIITTYLIPFFIMHK